MRRMAIRQARLNKLGLSALAARERSTVGRQRVGRNGLICVQESPGSAHNEIEGLLVEIGPCSVLAIRRSVSGSSQRGRVVGGSGEWRENCGQWHVNSGQ
jgi:hypothetical protein